MNNAAHMCGGETTRNLGGDGCCTSWNKGANAPQHRGEVLTVNKLHHDRWRFAIRRNVKHGSNVWMRDNSGGSALGTEAIRGSRGCCEWCSKHLNRDIAAERLVGCAED